MHSIRITMITILTLAFFGALVAQGNVSEVRWKNLRELNYKTGKMTPALKKLTVGKQVKIPGYMVPLEDGAGEVKEFLLVPYPQACIHVPAPPPNQIVHVTMGGARKAKVEMWEPIWIFGTLEVKDMKSIYATASYSLTGVKVEPYSSE